MIKVFIWDDTLKVSIFFVCGIKYTVSIRIKIILEILIFFTFSLGKMEAKIMNTIKIPPVNRIKKIKGIQVNPVFILIIKNMREEMIKIEKLAFIGLLE